MSSTTPCPRASKATTRSVISLSLSSALACADLPSKKIKETGRAGRDGESSVCILYYAFHDTQLLYRLIDDGDATPAQKENNKDNVRRVVQYCINEADCRRMQVLAYFGETFDPRDCHKTCDNCATPGGGKPKSDLSDVAKDAVGLVRSIEDDKITMIYAVDVFYGSKTAKVRPFFPHPFAEALY